MTTQLGRAYAYLETRQARNLSQRAQYLLVALAAHADATGSPCAPAWTSIEGLTERQYRQTLWELVSRRIVTPRDNYRLTIPVPPGAGEGIRQTRSWL